MHPEISLVLLSVLSGIGQGLFILLVLLDFLYMERLSGDFVYISLAMSFILPSLGILASTFHLGNPSRGYKAFRKWKQSWLSREMIFAPAFLFFVFAYTFLFYTGSPENTRRVAGVLGVLSSLGLYLSTSMLYAKIRFIKEWANAYTVINFFLLGLTSGFIAALAGLALAGMDKAVFDLVLNITFTTGAVALVMKISAYVYNARHYQPITENNALGISVGQIKILDWGTSYAHFNTKEYFFPITNIQIVTRQLLAITLIFVLPFILLFFFVPSAFSTGLTLVLITAGLVIERSLFFIQGNHIQNLYYGNFRKNMASNPILSSQS
ncbi:MAG: dimethyl sulfoxide reductase anchor subunit [Nitrospinota bacterium]|nr:dimethyl sulfoxide reductase anchor subunit [Nitrospinota bacterium]